MGVKASVGLGSEGSSSLGMVTKSQPRSGWTVQQDKGTNLLHTLDCDPKLPLGGYDESVEPLSNHGVFVDSDSESVALLRGRSLLGKSLEPKVFPCGHLELESHDPLLEGGSLSPLLMELSGEGDGEGATGVVEGRGFRDDLLVG